MTENDIKQLEAIKAWEWENTQPIPRK